MNIPLDRLYHFIQKLSKKIYNDNVIIYRFWPHGSKNLQDFQPLSNTIFADGISPQVWCHDQEPLNYDYYDYYDNTLGQPTDQFNTLIKKLTNPEPLRNFPHHLAIFDKCLLVHSEKRSQNLIKYTQTPSNRWQIHRLPVYYWSHAVIARDWFRYAEYEQFEKNISKRFLIYNRAWSGSREYRLKFTDLLIDHGLADQCLTFCNPVDNSVHYTDHEFKNPVWRPIHVLEHHVGSTLALPSASADFATEDYNSTEIEVVLETLFDDDRLHLTEKSLRPIACAQPFILVATHGSLQYLRDYGFKTFDTVWDETYDTIEDPYNRMLAIIGVMQTICEWTPEERLEKAQCIKEIVQHNQNYFFSKEFFNLVLDELKTNLACAFNQIKSDPGVNAWVERWQNVLKHAEIKEFLQQNDDRRYPTQDHYEQILKFIKEYPSTGSTDI